MSTILGGNFQGIYSEDDVSKGKCPAVGVYAQMVDSAGRIGGYLMCKVAASQNLIVGQVVTVAANHVVTVCAANAGAQSANASSANMLAVCINSITASASQQIWCQVFGRSNVLVTSASTNPGIALKISGTAGQVDASLTSISAFCGGIVLVATSGAANALTACFLTFPRFSPMGDTA